MLERKKNNGFVFVNILLFFIILMFYGIKGLSLGIKTATPLLPLSALIAFSMFCSEHTAAFSGLAVGIFCDSVSSAVPGFHSILFFLTGFFVSLIVHYLFRNNIRSALLLCAIGSILYFALRWLFLYCFKVSLDESLGYILKYGLPSALYTSVFIIPFYYLERRISQQ